MGATPTAVANAESRADLGRWIEERAALRRIATLVASGAPADELLAVVVKEVERLLSAEFVEIGRYEPDGAMTSIATSSKANDRSPASGRWIFGGNRSAATPIIIEGRVWGVMTASSSPGNSLPADTADRLADFTALVAAAIANADSRAALGMLGDEHAALRRVATLAARGVPSSEIVAAVAEEVGRLVSIDGTRILRYETDGTATVIAGWSEAVAVPPELQIGARLSLEDVSVAALVFRTGRPVRIDNYADAGGRLADALHEIGVQSAAGAPIIVEGRLWGAIAAGSTRPGPLPVGIELRLAEFTELVATAVANAESKAELTASRARIVAASDEARRRIERDLHDGAQQRLVSLCLELRAAMHRVPPELEELRGDLSRAAVDVESVLDDLREISRGIHPAILTEGGLGPALKTLARRAPIPVEVDIGPARRLPEPIEAAAYYVVSEALTNAARHAHASVARITLAEQDGTCRLSIRDDGTGGADPRRGSGLIGLHDRVEAVGGSIDLRSAVGEGTLIAVEFPLPADGILG